METIVGRWVAKAFHEGGESASVRPREVILLELTIPYNSPESLSNAKPCNCSEDGKLTALHTVTLNSLWPVMTDLASAENEEVILGGNNRDRDCSWTCQTASTLWSACTSVITSGVICVVKLCYAPLQTHILMTCTCNCSMHIQHNVMQLFHANSAPACTRSRSPHNVLHSPSSS